MEGVLLMWPCAEEMGGGGKRGRGRGGRRLLKRRRGEVGEGGQVARMPCGGMGGGGLRPGRGAHGHAVGAKTKEGGGR
jgi:hypothetical protein